ncbi:c-type cytochrome [Flavihumibacter profundi]|uniref:c-type cytochrome n=1 Tax=Flavihumibacter profundi TaxID=2716883 RepID=UPI001CC484B2|nr:c-type cytochrome [Flavihumibacter profundi]MBZ5859318.1 PQQ-dependent sugar dehydrogenase [Flavihumibacter profundi]
MQYILRLRLLLAVVILFSQCTGRKGLPPGDPNNGGLFLPGNFEAVIVADSIGSARHLAVTDNGDIYVKLRSTYPEGGNVALRDEDNDGKADIIKKFGKYVDEESYGTAMRIYNGYIYFSSASTVYRTKLTPGQLVPDDNIEVVLTDDFRHDPHGYQHIAKPVTFDENGNMYVPFGAPSDVCQVMDRIPESPGQMPCPELEEHGGIWKFDANKLNQTIKDGKRYATGIRSAVAIHWNHKENCLYIVQHGRDDLHRTWPAKYTRWQSALLPSEEFLQIREGADAGWPYYYYDQIQQKKLLNPEYGGDGKTEADSSKYLLPMIGFPAHWAPNDLFFYTGDQFPERYKNGAFIAFHGSTIRGPYSQSGYFVGFVPFKDGKPSGPWEVFADGFSGMDTIVNTSDAAGRPMGIAMGPDGSLYISDSKRGRIWRIMYKGDKQTFGAAELAAMEKRKMVAHIRTPDEVADNLEKGEMAGGEKIYSMYCIACHQKDGKGDNSRFPALDSSDWVNGDPKRLINVLLNGLNEPIKVSGRTFTGLMPKHSFLSDTDIALVLTYIRQNMNNKSGPITAEEVARERNKTSAKK